MDNKRQDLVDYINRLEKEMNEIKEEANVIDVPKQSFNDYLIDTEIDDIQKKMELEEFVRKINNYGSNNRDPIFSKQRIDDLIDENGIEILNIEENNIVPFPIERVTNKNYMVEELDVIYNNINDSLLIAYNDPSYSVTAAYNDVTGNFDCVVMNKRNGEFLTKGDVKTMSNSYKNLEQPSFINDFTSIFMHEMDNNARIEMSYTLNNGYDKFMINTDNLDLANVCKTVNFSSNDLVRFDLERSHDENTIRTQTNPKFGYIKMHVLKEEQVKTGRSIS